MSSTETAVVRGSPDDIATRLESLPVSAWHVRRLAVIGIAHFFDAFDALTIAFVMPVLAREWHLSAPQIGMAIALGYLGQAIGAVVFGGLAERIGRLRVLRWVLAILSVFSLASATTTGLIGFVLCRFLQGLGLGGEVPVAATYINEFCPSAARGRVVLALQVLFATGVFLSAIVALWVIPSWGWRAMFLIGGLPILLALLLPLLAPESARWLALKGRHREANAIVADIEASVARPGHSIDQSNSPLSSARETPLQSGSWSELLGHSLRKRTMMLWGIALCSSIAGYGILSWMPTVANRLYGLPIEQALLFGLTINGGAFTGNFLAFLLIDSIGRKATFTAGFLGGGIALLALGLFGLNLSATEVMMVAAVAMVFLAMPLSSLYVYAPELYPTSIRALGAGSASSWLRIGSIVGPILVGYILPSLGVQAVFAFFGSACLVGFVAILFFGMETSGRNLEDFSTH